MNEQLELNFDYVEQAKRTMSPMFEPQLVSGYSLERALISVIRSGENLDKMKKALFYGREIPGHAVPDSTECYQRQLKTVDSNPLDVIRLHCMIGCATEAAELAEQANNLISFPEKFDEVNVIEELGDLMWYIANYCDVAGVSLEDVMKKNIAKLQARFPDKFTEEAANNRNLDAERSILEG